MGRHNGPTTKGPTTNGSTSSETSAAQDRLTRTQVRNVVLAMVTFTLLVLAMIASYAGAFAKPTLHHLEVAVSAPQQMLDALDSRTELAVTPVQDDAAARATVLERKADAAFVVSPSGRSDTAPSGRSDTAPSGRSDTAPSGRSDTAPSGRLDIYVAGGGGRSVATAAENVGRATAAEAGLAPAVTDIAPTSAGDPSGTVEFYAVIFVSIGASVGAAAFGRMVGAVRRPRTLALRTLTLSVYSALLAGVVTVYVDAGLGALTGHPWQVFGALWLYAMAVGGAVTGVAAAFGTVAAMAVTAFLVIVGNAAAAGPIGRPLLSGFYAAFNHIVPQGSGVSLLRSIEYFGGHGALTPFATLAIWAATGCVLAVLATTLRLPAARQVWRHIAIRP